MKNVVKGFEIGKMAVPKIQASAINKGYQTYHTAHIPKLGKPPRGETSKTVKPMGVTRRGIKGL